MLIGYLFKTWLVKDRKLKRVFWFFRSLSSRLTGLKPVYGWMTSPFPFSLDSLREKFRHKLSSPRQGSFCLSPATIVLRGLGHGFPLLSSTAYILISQYIWMGREKVHRDQSVPSLVDWVGTPPTYRFPYSILPRSLLTRGTGLFDGCTSGSGHRTSLLWQTGTKTGLRDSPPTSYIERMLVQSRL